MTTIDSQEVEDSIKILEEYIKGNPKTQELKRALAVKLVLEKYRYEKIQQILSVSLGFISKWSTAFNRGGLEALKSEYKGKKGYLSSRQRQQIIEWLIQHKTWDVSDLEKYLIQEYDVVFKSRQSYYQILKEAKISWQKRE
ncbi:MAG: helix-turn-helix domain-containing protein [Cyanobacteria bacterium J06592_8]